MLLNTNQCGRTRSPVKDVEIKVLLKAALTDKINNREMFMKGVDHSYDYEGYNSYRTQDLAKQTDILKSNKVDRESIAEN